MILQPVFYRMLPRLRQKCNGQLSWSGLGNDMSTRIEIVDLSGRRVLSQQTNNNYLKLPGMQNGFYIVIATNGTDVLRKKIFFKG